VENPPSDSVSFLRALLAARQDYGERLIEQRLVVYQRWVKTFSPDRMNAAILEANKQLLLETLMKGYPLCVYLVGYKVPPQITWSVEVMCSCGYCDRKGCRTPGRRGCPRFDTFGS